MPTFTIPQNDVEMETRDNNRQTAEVRLIRHVTWVGFWVNAVLMALKIFFGIYGHSDALVADGIHSLSDFATDLIVIFFVGMAYKSADSDHPYGHGKFETFSTLIIGVFLLMAALGIAYSGAMAIVDSFKGIECPRPGLSTLFIAVASIVSKELLFRYTIRKARTVNSSSLTANAWHHRSDAISSIATVAGISAAYFLGDRWHILDPVASVLIAVFIAVSAIQICRPAIDELLDKSLSAEQVKRAEEIISHTGGVRAFHHLRTHRNGRLAIIDVHIKVQADISVQEGHTIATNVETALRQEFGKEVISNVHIEPYMPDQ